MPHTNTSQPTNQPTTQPIAKPAKQFIRSGEATERKPTLADLLRARFKAQVAHAVEAAIDVHARSIAADASVQALILV